jgi:hypothetical protein
MKKLQIDYAAEFLDTRPLGSLVTTGELQSRIPSTSRIYHIIGKLCDLGVLGLVDRRNRGRSELVKSFSQYKILASDAAARVRKDREAHADTAKSKREKEKQKSTKVAKVKNHVLDVSLLSGVWRMGA